MSKGFVVAGGTGGHIFPALAVAKELQQQGVSIEWIGSPGRLEEKVVPEHFSISYIDIAGLRGKSKLSLLAAPFRILKATLQSLRLLRMHQPAFVLVMGGYVCGPMGVAAKLKKIPVIVHEQNAVAGFTNRQLARFAHQVLQAFPNSFHGIEKTCPVVGNPVRQELMQIAPPSQRLHEQSGPLRLLVMGGSQGARFINQQVIAMLEQLPDRSMIQIWHQTGSLDYDSINAEYERIGFGARVTAFIDDMVEAYEWADCVMCRSGALTVSEIAAVGIASILVPLPIAVDDHQRLNAQVLVGIGAAEMMLQQRWSLAHLVETIQQWQQNRHVLVKMGEAARSVSHPEAVQQVARVCLASIKGKQSVSE